MSLTTGKIVEIMFENAIETHDKQDSLLTRVNFITPDPEKMQNSDNVIWKPAQQHAPIIDGWDLTGEETGIIEETYPSILGTPKNDFVRQRADKLRDKSFWEARGVESGLKQASDLNKAIASAVATQGGIFYRSNETNGYDFIAEAQALMNERQLYNSGRTFLMNDRDTKLFASDLAGRQTLQGRPEDAWAKSQIGSNVAGFDIFTGSYLPNIVGGADPATTVTGAQSFAPEGGSVNTTTGVVTNVDYRIAELPVAASANYNVGDKHTISNAGTPLVALGLTDKTETGEPMTFTIVGKPDATTIQIYPKPIAADDAALSTLEKAYANVDTTITNGATIDRLNVDATNKTNLFWDESAIEVIGGTIPAELFAQFSGSKVMTEQLANGLTMYLVYDGDIATMNFRCRMFVWYGITIVNPSNCGAAVSY